MAIKIKNDLYLISYIMVDVKAISLIDARIWKKGAIQHAPLFSSASQIFFDDSSMALFIPPRAH